MRSYAPRHRRTRPLNGRRISRSDLLLATLAYLLLLAAAFTVGGLMAHPFG